MNVREAAVALGCYTALGLALLAPALLGAAAVVPQELWSSDPLYRQQQMAEPLRQGDHTLLAADMPRDLAFARGLRAGRFDLWNPNSGAGAPLWAEQGGPLFPLKLAIYADPTPSGYALFLLLRLIVAGCGAWALGRWRGLSAGGALGAGAFFELSGAMIAQLPFGSASATSLLPWLVLGAAAIARTRSGRAVAATALPIGIAASAGHPTVAAIALAGFAAAVAATCVALLRRAPRAAFATAGLGMTALLLGLLLAAPTWMPLAELMAQGNSYKGRMLGAMSWQAALMQSRGTAPLAFLAPGPLRMIFASTGPLHDAAAVIGVGGLVLALAGLWRRGLDAALLGVALLGVWLTLAPPGLDWLSALTGARAVVPYYAWSLIALPLTQCAGRGLEGLADAAGLRAALVALIVVGLGLAALVVVGAPAARINPWVGTVTLAERFREVLATGAGRAALLMPLGLAAAALAGAALLRGRGLARIGVGLAGGLACAELVALWWPSLRHPAVELDRGAPPPAVAFLQRQLAGGDARMTAFPSHVGFPLTPMLFDLPDLRNLSALPIDRYLQYLIGIDADGSRFVIQQTALREWPLLDVAAVKYAAVARRTDPPPPLLFGDPEIPLVFTTPAVAIYENRAALPRVRIVHRDRRVPAPGAARAELKLLNGRALHARDGALRDVAVIEPDADGAYPPPLDAAGASDGDTVRITDATDPDRIAIAARLSSPGWVVVADTYYPGWTATVDGQPASIHPANGMFRAVYATAGEHAIEMRYAPGSFRLGVLLGAVGALLCALLSWRSR